MRRWRTLVLAALGGLALAAGARDTVDVWVSRAELPPLLQDSSVEVLARGGELLRAFQVEDGRWRLATQPEAVDPLYLEALIAYEDKRFYNHSGVDPLAAARAGWQALIHRRIVSGGSTLTMQLARLLENGSTGSWTGKLRQMQLALALERRFSKREILALYLTHAPFGGNLEGVRAASYAYFGKEPARLTPAQIALLVALPQAPETRRPDLAPGRATAARDAVLHRLHARSVLSREALMAAARVPIPRSQTPFPALAFHSAERAKALNPNSRTIRTTLDADLQRRLEKLARARLSGIEPKATIALIVADHTSGEVLASIGSAARPSDTNRKAFIDMTRAVRSPGSALKPLVYAMAFDLGLAHPETLINDAPVRFGSYQPSNFDGAFRGEVTLREALQLSLNTPVVSLLDRIGPERFLLRLRQAGVTPHLGSGRAGLAVALGGIGVSLYDMTELYAGLAEGGHARPLHEIADTSPENLGPPFVNRSAAWLVSDTLAATHGRKPTHIALKTGTSYGYRDNWAFGYDGKHVVGVWVGRPDGTAMQETFARETAAPLLREVFQYAAPRRTPLAPPPPEALLVSTSELPQPLRHFGRRDALSRAAAAAPDIVFPPTGVRLAALDGMPMLVKLRGGTPPYSIFSNGQTAKLGLRSTEADLGPMLPGFYSIRVIDAAGRAAKTEIEVR